MRFLIKMFVLGFIGLAVLPSVAPEQYRTTTAEAEDGAQAPSAFELAAVIGQAAADIRGICERRPGVCETGSELISYSGEKAREGLEIAYAMFRHGHPSMQKAPAENVSLETTAGIEQ